MKNISEVFIQNSLLFEEKSLFNLYQYKKSISNLRKIRYFSKVISSIKRTQVGLNIQIYVKEKPIIKKIIVKKKENLYLDFNIEGLIAKFIREGDIYNGMDAKSGVREIEKTYREQGFNDVEVKHSCKINLIENTCKLQLYIKEGIEYQLETLELIGTNVFTKSEIEKKAKIENNSFWEKGAFDLESHSLNIEKLLDLYRTNGYINVKILEERHILKKVEGNKHTISIKLNVLEGLQFRFRKYIISGEKKLTRSIKKLLHLKQGNIFDYKRYINDNKEIVKLFKEKGYILATIKPKVIQYTDSKKIDIFLKIENMKQYRLANVRIRGRHKIKKKMILFELSLKKGDLISFEKIESSKDNLDRLGIFSEIKFEFKKNDEYNFVDLDIILKPRDSSVYAFGFGYGTKIGYSIFESIYWGNFNDKGIKLYEEVQLSPSAIFLQGAFQIPWMFDGPYDIMLSANYLDKKIDRVNHQTSYGEINYKYNYESRGSSFGVLKKLNSYLNLGFYYGFRAYKFSNFEPLFESSDVSLDIDKGHPYLVNANSFYTHYFVKSTLTFKIEYDSRNSFADPREGSHLFQFWSVSGGLLGGNDSLMKFVSSATKYFAMTKFNTFLIRGNLGLLTGLINAPITNAGYGFQSGLRGNYGQKDWLKEGGFSKINFVFEHRVHLPIINLIVFVEGSNIWDKANLINLDFNNYYYSGGFGLHINISVLPLRMYISRRIKVGGTTLQQWEFSFYISQNFGKSDIDALAIPFTQKWLMRY